MDASVLTVHSKNTHQLCVDTRCNLEDLPRWMIGTDSKEESENFVQSLQHDDDDDVCMYANIYSLINLLINGK